jgi:hypothetical protein
MVLPFLAHHAATPATGQARFMHPLHGNEGRSMAPTYRVERDRGSKEFPQQLGVLRERWPLAFPMKHEDVRPLAMGAAR